MKKKEKQGLVILIVIAIIIIAIIWIVTRQKAINENMQQTDETKFTKVESDGTVVNTSEKLKENKVAEGFEITNITFKEKNGETELTASVTNKTNSNQASFFGNIVLLDKKENEIGRIPVMISDTQNGETIDIEATITEKYVNAYNFRLEK